MPNITTNHAITYTNCTPLSPITITNNNDNNNKTAFKWDVPEKRIHISTLIDDS